VENVPKTGWRKNPCRKTWDVENAKEACLRWLTRAAKLAGKFKVRQGSNSAIRRFLHAHFTPADDKQADCAKSGECKCGRFRHGRRREESGIVARIAEIITYEFPTAV
jgi:hypothetical protein